MTCFPVLDKVMTDVQLLQFAYQKLLVAQTFVHFLAQMDKSFAPLHRLLAHTMGNTVLQRLARTIVQTIVCQRVVLKDKCLAQVL